MDLLQHLIIPPRSDHSDHPSSPPAHPTLTSSLITRPLSDSLASEVAMQTSAPAPDAPLSPSAENTSQQPDPVSPLNNALSIEEFERLHGGALAGEKQQSAHPSSPKTPNKTFSGAPTFTFTPTSISTRSPANTIEFNHRSQTLGLTRVIEYTGDTVSGWGARLSLVGRVLEDMGPYQSKKEAKEKICGLGLELLKELAEKGEIYGGKKKGGAGGAMGESKTNSVDEGLIENWIGLLLELSRSIGIPEPVYTEFRAGNLFSCEAEIAQRPGQPFGGRDDLYPSKKAAQKNAARQAVEWLRAEGLLPESGPVKKKKAKANSANGDTNGTANSAINKSESPAEEERYAHKVLVLAGTLSLPAPEYRCTPADPRNTGLWNVAAYFSHIPSHEGPVGEVGPVLGKKAAKEECAKRVLAFLKEEEQKRNQFAQGVLDGLKQ